MQQEGQHKDNSYAIVKRCKSGDEAAFFELYSLYAKTMLNVSYRIVNNRAEAEDILQEAFLSAFQNINTFSEKVSFGSWLKRIVVNRSIDVLRKQKHDLIQMDQIEQFQSEEKEDADEDSSFSIATVRKCIQQLPNGYRIVLSLYLIEGYSHKEIAEILNVKEATSKSQFNRAKGKLQLLIKQQSKHE